MRKLLATLAPLAIALGLGVVAAVQPPQPAQAASGSYPTPVPTVAPTGLPPNIIQYQVISGCYHNTNGACPAPSPNTINQAITDWQYLGTIISYIETDIRAHGLASAAGVTSLSYLDPVYIHGTTVYNGSKTYCPSDTNPFPAGVLSRMRDYGEVGIMVNDNQTTCGGQTVGTEIGDITAPQAGSFWTQVYKYNFAFNNPGVSGTFQTASGLSAVRVDDYLSPFLNTAQSNIICQGPAHLTSGGTQTGCTNVSPFSTQIDESIFPYSQQNDPHPIPSWYINGARNFFRAFKSLGTPVVVNNLYDPTESEVFYGQADHANILSMQCENCITVNPYSGGGTSLWNEANWQNHINSEIVASSQGVIFDDFNPVELNQAEAIYNYVSLGLGMIDPTKVMVMEQCQSGLSLPTSGICISPIALVVPSQPLADPANLVFNPFAIGYQASTPPANYGVATLKHNSFYSREFKACYVQQVNIGACAYVLNPPGASTITITGLRGTYAHSVSYTGTGILNNGAGFTDAYTISYSSSAAPTTLATGTAAILTP